MKGNIMENIKRLLKVVLTVCCIFIILFVVFSNLKPIFKNNEDVIYLNWEIRLPKGGKELYYTDSGASFHGDGERYSVYKYENKEVVENSLKWIYKKDENIENEVEEVLEQLKEYDKQIPKSYRIDFNKDYKYIKKIESDNSTLYLIYIIDENKIYVVENLL